MIAPPRSISAAARANASWMVTLADLLALLLTFFVLLFSMNAVQIANWQSVIASFRKQFNPEAARVMREPVPDASAVRQFEPWGADLGYLAAVLRNKLGEPPLERARLTRLADRLVISLPADALFDPADGASTLAAYEVARVLATDLSRLANAIRVSARSLPVEDGGEAEAGWTIALERADTMAALLARAGYDRPIIAGASGLPAQGVEGAAAERIDVEIMPTRGEGSDER